MDKFNRSLDNLDSLAESLENMKPEECCANILKMAAKTILVETLNLRILIERMQQASE